MLKEKQPIDLRKMRLDKRKEDHVLLKRNSFSDIVTLVNRELVERWTEKIERKKEVLILPRIQSLVNEYDLHIPGISMSRLIDHIFDAITGYDILHPYVANPAVQNIEVEGPDEIYVMENLRWRKAPVAFGSEKELQDYIHRIFNRLGGRFSLDNPLGKVEDYDWNLRIRAGGFDIRPDGPSMSIRKLSKRILNQSELDYGMSRMLQSFVQFCMDAGFNVSIIGPFGSGKTRMLGTLLSMAPKFKHVGLIQSANEIPRVHPFMRRSLTRDLVGELGSKISEADLIDFAKQEMYSVLGIGEFLDEAAISYLHVLQLGIQVLNTYHAYDRRSAVHSLTYMMKRGGSGFHVDYLVEQLAEHMNILIIMDRLRVVEIGQFTGRIDAQGNPESEPLFRFEIEKESKHELIGEWRTVPDAKLCEKLVRKARLNGVTIPPELDI